MSVENKIKYKEWAVSQQLPVFFQPWWMDMISDKWDAAIAEKQGKIQAVWPFIPEKKLHISIIRNPLLTPYSGPLFFLPEHLSSYKRIGLEEKLIYELMKKLPKWDFMDLMTVPGFSNFLPFHHSGFAHTLRLTYQLDLSSSPENIWNAIQSKIG